MVRRGTPPGFRVLAGVSLTLGLGGLLFALSTRRVDSLLFGSLHLLAAYGLWTAVRWGTAVAVLAYAAGGVVAALASVGDPIELTLALGLAGVATGYLLVTALSDGAAPPSP